MAAFAAIKEALAKAALLTHPQPGAPLCLVTDASDRAVGAVLQQSLNGVWQPILFFLRSLSPLNSVTVPLTGNCLLYTWPSSTFGIW